MLKCLKNLCFSRVKAEKEAKAVSLQQAIRDKPPVLPESNLKDLGINSIKCIEMLVEIEDLYGVEFPEDEVKEELFVNVQNIFNTLTRIAQS